MPGPICIVRPTNATAKQRRGAESSQGLPAALVDRTFQPEFVSDDFTSETEAIDSANIRPSGHVAVAIPGKKIATGTTVAEPDADGLYICLASALRKQETTEVLGGGAFRTRHSRSAEFDAVCSYTRQIDIGDGVSEEGVGTQCMDFAFVLANAAIPSVTVTEEAEFTSVWDLGVGTNATNPATGLIRLRGNPENWIDRVVGGNVHMKLIDRFANPKGNDELVFLGIQTRPGAITGTWTVGAGLSAFTGTGGDAKNQLALGDVLQVDGELLEVATITDADNFTTAGTSTAGITSELVDFEYGAEGAASLETFSVFAGDDTVANLHRWNNVANSSGGFMGTRASDATTIQVHLTAAGGLTAGTKIPLPGGGTVTVSNGSDVVTGSGTSFLADTRIGDRVFTPGDTVGKFVLEKTSDTVLRVNSNYSAAEAGVVMDVRPIPVVALAGTYTTAGTTALVGAGGNLTSLLPGDLIITPAGEERRLFSIADDDNAVVTFAFTGSEAAVAMDTDVSFRFNRLQPDWVAVTHPSGPFTELLAEVNLFILTPDGQEEKISIVGDATWNYAAGRARQDGIGSPFAALIKDSGSSTGVMELTVAKLSTTIRKATDTSEQARIRIVMSTGVKILTSDFEYTWEHIIHIKASGKHNVVADATTDADRLGGAMFDNPGDPDGFFDAYTLIVTSDDPDPFAIA